MKYQQRQYPFYNPNLVRMSMGTLDFVVNYADMLDQTCVEFQHVHDCYEIYYCLSGMQHLMIDGEQHVLTADSFAVIRPGVHHYTVYEPTLLKQYVVFVFTPPTANSSKSRSKGVQSELEFLSAALRYFEEHTHFICKDRFQSNAVLKKLGEEIGSDRPGKNQMINALYQQYLITIFRHLVSAKQEEAVPSNINLAIAMTKYMHANYNKNISLQDIADVFYVSPRHINRVFEEYFGQSFKRTLNIYRLNYAKNYLMDTNYPAEKISELVGFSSPKMLYQLFKEIEGTTVSEFRARYRKDRT
ncbi:AraC family transcriptional regulator [Intestinibacillus sp. Marseille-P6563]|uniref:AraC family transcriptional regulator n=1 Tax=Intestinibacillus sp. Marseille-P6563 TaxID=2364792 RepID=UPI000F0667A8|nr:AraC family transcriptional regulator [Intestinibacillus sp. Marseille-P6563]